MYHLKQGKDDIKKVLSDYCPLGHPSGIGTFPTEEVTHFLKYVDCDRLILNGDIIDGWQLKKSGKRWKQKHTDFFKVLMKMMEKRGTEIIYVVGNHHDFLDNLAPFKFSNISIVKDYLLKTRQGKRYFVTHGDIFDTVTTHMRWLARLGDVGYTFLLWLNKVYNHRRERQGKTYFSLSQEVKHQVKVIVFISQSQELVRLAEAKRWTGLFAAIFIKRRTYGMVMCII